MYCYVSGLYEETHYATAYNCGKASSMALKKWCNGHGSVFQFKWKENTIFFLRICKIFYKWFI